MELARADPSIATFMGVQGGLAMGSILSAAPRSRSSAGCRRWRELEQIGAFALTEPEVGSGVAGGLTTTARRDGDGWVLDGQKKWIGNATFADLTVVWARDVADGQVKGFVVEKDTPGFTAVKMEDKIALRVVQNALITHDGVRVPEDYRLPGAHSFRDTAEVLRMTRAGVAWSAVGCARGAYEHALRYALGRQQFGRPIAGFQLVQDLLARMLGNTVASQCMVVRLAQLDDAGRCATSTPRWPRPSAPRGCGRPSAGRGSSWPATASCSTTTSAGSSPTPRRSTPTRARGR